MPIFKRNGDIQDCGNHRNIKLMNLPHHESLENINKQALERQVKIGNNQCVLMPGKSPIHCNEKYREEEKSSPAIDWSIDMIKAYDCVPRKMT